MEAQGMTSVLMFWWGRTRYMAEVKRLVRDTVSSAETPTAPMFLTSFLSQAHADSDEVLDKKCAIRHLYFTLISP